MLSATHPVLVIFLIIRGTNGDSVNQTEVPVVLPEEAPMTLNCTYQTTYSVSGLFWYVQYLNKAPQLLLKGSTANPRPKEQGFQATLVKSDKTFHLQKRSVQTSDSAVYYCAVSDTVRGAAGGAEHKPRGHRRDQRRLSEPDRSPSDSFGGGYYDPELHLPDHLFRFLCFLVHSVSQPSSSVPPEGVNCKPEGRASRFSGHCC
uniref:Uncharacterized LOC110261595 n=1 Tax=Sus scrofa TaxID=9823 RepID=A0A4X1V0P4_PIG